MILFDQIAVCTRHIDEQIRAYQANGHPEWVQDRVKAVHIYLHPDIREVMGESFEVKLAFNYTVMPMGLEYELLELVLGKSYQLQSDSQLLSHFGYHTKNDQAEHGDDSLLMELLKLQQHGFDVMQVSQTVAHTGTKRRYRYAYVNPRLGAPIKIIQRLLPTKDVNGSLQQGRELFACLSSR